MRTVSIISLHLWKSVCGPIRWFHDTLIRLWLADGKYTYRAKTLRRVIEGQGSRPGSPYKYHQGSLSLGVLVSIVHIMLQEQATRWFIPINPWGSTHHSDLEIQVARASTSTHFPIFCERNMISNHDNLLLYELGTATAAELTSWMCGLYSHTGPSAQSA